MRKLLLLIFAVVAVYFLLPYSTPPSSNSDSSKILNLQTAKRGEILLFEYGDPQTGYPSSLVAYEPKGKTARVLGTFPQAQVHQNQNKGPLLFDSIEVGSVGSSTQYAFVIWNPISGEEKIITPKRLLSSKGHTDPLTDGYSLFNESELIFLYRPYTPNRENCPECFAFWRYDLETGHEIQVSDQIPKSTGEPEYFGFEAKQYDEANSLFFFTSGYADAGASVERLYVHDLKNASTTLVKVRGCEDSMCNQEVINADLAKLYVPPSTSQDFYNEIHCGGAVVKTDGSEYIEAFTGRYAVGCAE